MLTKKDTLALRKAGLAGVCEFNGRLMWGDGRELTAAEKQKAEHALSGSVEEKPHKTGWPKGKSRK